MRFILFLLAAILLMTSCNSKAKNLVDVSDINVEFEVHRFENAFYQGNGENLADLRKAYPYLFPEGFTDSIALQKINNKDERELFLATQKMYKDFTPQQQRLEQLFKHVKYYNSTFTPPKVITLLTNIDYEHRIVFTDSLLFISLDAYLGEDHPFYQSFPNYVKQNNTQKRILVDVAAKIIETQIHSKSQRTFVAKMVEEGKKMLLIDKYLPALEDHIKIGYSQDKYAWAVANEPQVWAYFIENKHLFSTSSDLQKRFLDSSPFSKFYTTTDNNSPGRIGVWMGWQIVKSFAENNDVSLQEILEKDPIKLFEESNYKPKK